MSTCRAINANNRVALQRSARFDIHRCRENYDCLVDYVDSDYCVSYAAGSKIYIARIPSHSTIYSTCTVIINSTAGVSSSRQLNEFHALFFPQWAGKGAESFWSQCSFGMRNFLAEIFAFQKLSTFAVCEFQTRTFQHSNFLRKYITLIPFTPPITTHIFSCNFMKNSKSNKGDRAK